MIDIDFLPETYRQRHQQRQARTWSVFVFCMFGAVLLLTSILQYSQRRQAAFAWDLMWNKLQEARSLQQEYRQLESELQQADEAAGLYASLDLTCRRSQMLRIVAERVPDAIRLKQVRFGTENRNLPTFEPTFQENSAADAQKKSPALKDREYLQRLCAGSPPVLLIAGETTDSAHVHDYLQKLATSSLFESIRLEAIEQADRSETGTSRTIGFRVRATVRTAAFESPTSPPATLAQRESTP